MFPHFKERFTDTSKIPNKVYIKFSKTVNLAMLPVKSKAKIVSV